MINFQKAGTFPMLALTIWYYADRTPAATSPVAWMYLALHGSYGLVWLLKDLAFPDPNWQRRATIASGLYTLAGLVLYWSFGWLLISGTVIPQYPLPEPQWFALCVTCCILGCALMIAADAQKYFTLRIQRGLITDGVHRYVRHPNYLGEILVYASFALLVGHWWPWVVLGWIWVTLFATNMVMKEASLSRYAGWAEYKRRSWWLRAVRAVARRGSLAVPAVGPERKRANDKIRRTGAETLEVASLGSTRLIERLVPVRQRHLRLLSRSVGRDLGAHAIAFRTSVRGGATAADGPTSIQPACAHALAALAPAGGAGLPDRRNDRRAACRLPGHDDQIRRARAYRSPLFGVVWLGFSVAAWLCARRRDFIAARKVHDPWLRAGDGVCLGSRAWYDLQDEMFPFISNVDVRNATCEWLSFVVPLLIVETWLSWWPALEKARKPHCPERKLPDLRSRLKTIPEGAAALFFIQIFATLGFAVLYSTLVLYATRHLHFSAKEASAIMGVFGAFNYGLHLFGGYLGGRFLSNRNLFVGGMLLQVLGCGTMSVGTVETMYLGLALFLTGSGLNVTCINMMLTQRFAPADLRRESAFFWNYAGMNLGFFIGFAVAGHYQLTESYSRLFLFATVGNFLAIVLAFFNWKALADRSTRLLEVTPRQYKARFVAGIAILIGVVPIVWFMLQRTGSTSTIFKTFSVVLAGVLVYLTMKHKDPRERNNMWAYLILALGSLVFWSLYQMAPNGLQLFAVNNVRLRVWGVEIAPQWVQNINTVSIVIGGPLLAALFAKWRARGWKVDIPQQFAVALILMGLGFLALPIGISFADTAGRQLSSGCS